MLSDCNAAAVIALSLPFNLSHFSLRRCIEKSFEQIIKTRFYGKWFTLLTFIYGVLKGIVGEAGIRRNPSRHARHDVVAGSSPRSLSEHLTSASCRSTLAEGAVAPEA